MAKAKQPEPVPPSPVPEPAPTIEPEFFCPVCNAGVGEIDVKCATCGAVLEDDEETDTEPAADAAAAAAVAATATVAAEPAEPEPKREYERIPKCRTHRKQISRYYGGEFCDRKHAPTTEADALEALAPVLAIWNDPVAYDAWLNPPETTAEIIVDAKALQAFVAQVKAVSVEGRILFEPDGLHVKVVDPAHVELADIKLPSSSLDRYDVFADGKRFVPSCEAGVDFEKVLGVLKGQKAKVGLTFRLSRNRLEVAQNGSSRTMGLLDTAGMTDAKVPTFPVAAKVAVDGKAFLETLKAAGEVSDHVAITVTPTALRIEAEGDVDRYKHEFPAGTDAVEYLTRVTGDYRSLFPLDYFENMVKSVVAEDLEITFGNDYPLRATWRPTITRKVGDQATDFVLGEVVALIAPRIESE